MFYAEKFSANYKFFAVVNPYQCLFPHLSMAYAPCPCGGTYMLFYLVSSQRVSIEFVVKNTMDDLHKSIERRTFVPKV